MTAHFPTKTLVIEVAACEQCPFWRFDTSSGRHYCEYSCDRYFTAAEAGAGFKTSIPLWCELEDIEEAIDEI